VMTDHFDRMHLGWRDGRCRLSTPQRRSSDNGRDDFQVRTPRPADFLPEFVA
jgi:hypothetical protein